MCQIFSMLCSIILPVSKTKNTEQKKPPEHHFHLLPYCQSLDGEDIKERERILARQQWTRIEASVLQVCMQHSNVRTWGSRIFFCTPPPVELSDHIVLELQKMFFFPSGQLPAPLPSPLSGRATKKIYFFFAAFLIIF